MFVLIDYSGPLRSEKRFHHPARRYFSVRRHWARLTGATLTHAYAWSLV